MDPSSSGRPSPALAAGSLAALAAAAKSGGNGGGGIGSNGGSSLRNAKQASSSSSSSYASARANVTLAASSGSSKHHVSGPPAGAAASTAAANAATTAPAAPRALQLVRLNPRTGQMEVGSEALAALRACKGPVGVVAVAGRARSGKSFVLNAILRRAAGAAAGAAAATTATNDADDVCSPGGFALAHSYRPCTKGLWLWSSPVGPIDSLTGQQQQQHGEGGGGGCGGSGGSSNRPRRDQHHLVLLDTEGIDAYDQTTTDGVRIFALAVLLSSLFVFNQFGAIDEAALDRLSLVTELTRHIRVRADAAAGDGGAAGGKRGGSSKGRPLGEGNGDADDEEDDEEEERRMRQLGAVNPRLLWLLRDFYFDLDEEEEEDGHDGGGFDEEEEEEDDEDGFSGGGSGRGRAPCLGDVRASATFEGGWPPQQQRPSAAPEAALNRRRHQPPRPRTTPRDYLEAALAPARPRPGGGIGHGGHHHHQQQHQQQQQHAAALAAKNAVRQSIKALFPDRDCFTLVRPVGDERQLRRLDALPASALRPEFRRAVGKLARLVLERAGPKTIAGGNVVTGTVLAGLAEAYVAAINAGAVPTIATAWQGVAERECRRAAREAEDAYCREFGCGGGGGGGALAPPPVLNEPEALDAEHRRALAVARRVFAEEAVGGEEDEDEGEEGGGEEGGGGGKNTTSTSTSSTSARAVARRALEAALERRFALVRARALADADAHAERLLSEGRQRVSAAARLGAGGWRDVSAAVAAVQQEYSATAGGTAKWPRLLSFVSEAYDAAGAEVAERLKAAAEARIERAELAAREARAEAREQRARAEAAERRVFVEEEEGRRRFGGGGPGGPGGGATGVGAYHHPSQPQNGLLAWLGCLGGGGGGGGRGGGRGGF